MTFNAAHQLHVPTPRGRRVPVWLLHSVVRRVEFLILAISVQGETIVRIVYIAEGIHRIDNLGSVQCCAVPAPAPPPCTNSQGVQGTCVPTADCRAKGGVSAPGFCAGPTDIQCCTAAPPPPPPAPAPCKNGQGVQGTCIPTANCKATGGVSAPGFCAGPADSKSCQCTKVSRRLSYQYTLEKRGMSQLQR